MRLTFLFLILFCTIPTAAAPLGEPTAVCGAGRLYKIDGVFVPVLRGNWYEMGRQYGTLLKNEMRQFHQLIKIGLAAYIGAEKFETGIDLLESQLRLYPQRFREMHRGMTDGSGLSYREIAVLEHFIALQVAVGRGLFCSTLCTWGNYTSDGQMIVGRNFDYPYIYLPACPFLCLAVFHPDDGSVVTASLGYIGSLGAVNMFNADGLVAEVNMAVNMPNGNHEVHLDRITAPISLTAIGFDCSEIQQLDAALKTYRFNFPLLCTVADTHEAWTYEIGTLNLVRRSAGESGDEPGLLTATNWACSADWKEIQPETGDGRRENLQLQARKQKGKINSETMKQIFSIEYAKGGALSNVSEITTLHQFIYVPANRLLSVRQPYFKNKNWIDIDLKPLFAK